MSLLAHVFTCLRGDGDGDGNADDGNGDCDADHGDDYDGGGDDVDGDGGNDEEHQLSYMRLSWRKYSNAYMGIVMGMVMRDCDDDGDDVVGDEDVDCGDYGDDDDDELLYMRLSWRMYSDA